MSVAYAVALLVLVAVYLAYPMFRRSGAAGESKAGAGPLQASAELDATLRELESDLDLGRLSAGDYRQLRQENLELKAGAPAQAPGRQRKRVAPLRQLGPEELIEQRVAGLRARAGSCPNCRAQRKPGAEFCPQCGARYSSVRACPRCGAPAGPGDRFCGECGGPVPESKK